MRGVKEGRSALQTNFSCHFWITALYRRAGIGLQREKCGGLRPHSATMSEYILTLLVILGFGDILASAQTLRDADSERGKTQRSQWNLQRHAVAFLLLRFEDANRNLTLCLITWVKLAISLRCCNNRWCNSNPYRKPISVIVMRLDRTPTKGV